MPILVIGGHTRNIGKTSLVAGLIAALPHLNWTAIKITQHDHTIHSELIEDQIDGDTISISEERDPTTGTDTSRFLAAGARRAFFVRSPEGQLAKAMPPLDRIIADSENSILESNSILRFLQPDLFLTVLDPSMPDFKPSALRYLDRADALIVSRSTQPAGATVETLPHAWPDVSPPLLAGKPLFFSHPPRYCGDDLIHFVTTHLNARLQPFPEGH